METTQISIFNYTDYRSFLLDFYETKKQLSENFSFGVWARFMGMPQTASLTRIVQGKRLPSTESTKRLASYFKWQQKEEDFFKTLVLHEKHKGDSELRVLILEQLRQLHPRKEFNLIDHRSFLAISKWYYFVIREMVNLPDFKEDIDWIQKRLQFKLTATEIKSAIDTLVDIGLLDRENDKLINNGRYFDCVGDVANEGSKRHHEDNLDLSKKALREVDINLREFNSVCFNIEEKDIPAFKEELRNFKDSLVRKFESTKGEQTYQYQQQLFPYTRNTTGA